MYMYTMMSKGEGYVNRFHKRLAGLAAGHVCYTKNATLSYCDNNLDSNKINKIQVFYACTLKLKLTRQAGNKLQYCVYLQTVFRNLYYYNIATCEIKSGKKM